MAFLVQHFLLAHHLADSLGDGQRLHLSLGLRLLILHQLHGLPGNQ